MPSQSTTLTRLLDASMRPPEFTGGNPTAAATKYSSLLIASMRPPEFTGGNATTGVVKNVKEISFNEAAGIHRRKLLEGVALYGAEQTLQ